MIGVPEITEVPGMIGGLHGTLEVLGTTEVPGTIGGLHGTTEVPGSAEVPGMIGVLEIMVALGMIGVQETMAALGIVVVLGHRLQMEAVYGIAVVLHSALDLELDQDLDQDLELDQDLDQDQDLELDQDRDLDLDLIVFPLIGLLMLGAMTKTMCQNAILMEGHVVEKMFKLHIAQFVNANRINF